MFNKLVAVPTQVAEEATDQVGPLAPGVSTYPVVLVANVVITPVPEKYGIFPIVTAEKFCPVPPYCVPTAVPFHVPAAIVPTEVIAV